MFEIDDWHPEGRRLNAAKAACLCADSIVLGSHLDPEIRYGGDWYVARAAALQAYEAGASRDRIEALEAGCLTGAALDVFEEEPLPEESHLWDLENVIISPHSTDNVPGLTNELQAKLFRENLRRYLDGEPLKNELDKRLLY